MINELKVLDRLQKRGNALDPNDGGKNIDINQGNYYHISDGFFDFKEMN